MFQAMKDYWWLILIEGVIAVIFGVFVLLNPAISAVSLVIAFGVYAVASGGITFFVGLFGSGETGDRVMLAIQGILQAIVGVLVLTWPGISMISLLFAISIYAFVGGIVAIVGAFQNRDGWLGLSGVVSVLFGIYAFRFPGDGALAVLFAIGIYAIVVGVTLIIGSFQVRKVGKTLSPSAA
jgi:uncharacterized membrane protein HdeD (DUF308 family)